MANGRYLLDDNDRERIANDARQQARSDHAEHTALDGNAQGEYLAHQVYDPLIKEWAELWEAEYESEYEAEYETALIKAWAELC